VPIFNDVKHALDLWNLLSIDQGATPQVNEFALRVLNSAFVNPVFSDFRQHGMFAPDLTHAPNIDLKTPLSQVLISVAKWIENGSLDAKTSGVLKTGEAYLLNVVLNVHRLAISEKSNNNNLRLFLRIEKNGKAEYLLGKEQMPNGQYQSIDHADPTDLLKMLNRN
jgi:hypothetical protein